MLLSLSCTILGVGLFIVTQATTSGFEKFYIRAVLGTIFNSDLFRSHTAVAQKVKTPLEFVASSLRALRTTNSNGGLTATTDGYSFNNPNSSSSPKPASSTAAPSR